MNNPCVRCQQPSYSRGLCARCYTRRHNGRNYIISLKRRLREAPVRHERLPTAAAPEAYRKEKSRRIENYRAQVETTGVIDYSEI